MRYTIKTFQTLADETFPSKNFKILSFNGVARPITIVCPTHGVQTVSAGQAFIRSKHGCPACGLVLSTSVLASRGRSVSILDTATGETLSFPSVQAAAKALNTSYGSIRIKLDGRSSPDNLVCNRYKVMP
ncbi:TPA: DUF723 domain-containing protein [Neisseria meningitidis]